MITSSNRFVSVLLVLTVLLAACAQQRVDAPERAVVALSDIKVLDGDTISHQGTTVRLLGFDAPEKANPTRFRGSQEPWATRATDKLKELLATAKTLEIAYAKQGDKYGRKLAHLYIDGITVGASLVAAGLAYPNVDHFGPQGFEVEAEQLRKAAREGPKPEFDEPHRWRSKNTLKVSKC